MSALAPTTGVKNRKGGGPGAARRGKRLRRAGRAGFARLSGWQPIGNWVVSAANFPASQLPIGVTPTTSRESRRAVCAEKWPEAQAERDSAYHRKAENHLRGGGSFLSSAPGRAAPQHIRSWLRIWREQGSALAAAGPGIIYSFAIPHFRRSSFFESGRRICLAARG